MRIFENIKTTLIGVFFIFVALYFEWENWVMFAFIGIGILLLFAKDEIPAVIRKITTKFFGNDKNT